MQIFFILISPDNIACEASVSSRVMARKLEREQKKKRRGRGMGRLLLPRHSFFFFFALVPTFLDELARKRLPRRLIGY